MKVGAGTLVLVADGQKMLLFKNAGTAQNVQLEVISHKEEANPPTREHGTDTPGRTHSRMDARRSSYSETDWHDQSERDFAVQVAQGLEVAANRNPGSDLIVIAAPQTLGTLRKRYSQSTSARIRAELGLDLVNCTVDDVTKAIAAHEPT